MQEVMIYEKKNVIKELFYWIKLPEMWKKKYTYKMHLFAKFKIWNYANIYPSFYLKAKYE